MCSVNLQFWLHVFQTLVSRAGLLCLRLFMENVNLVLFKLNFADAQFI